MVISRRQGDPRWGSKKIGNSPYTIAAFGCLITAISDACVWWGKPQFTPDTISERCSFTQDGRLLWKSVDKIGLTFLWRYYSENRKVIDSVLKHKTKCVFLEFNLGKGSHWVWCTGKDWLGRYKIADPLRGDFSDERRYGKITGFAVIDYRV